MFRILACVGLILVLVPMGCLFDDDPPRTPKGNLVLSPSELSFAVPAGESADQVMTASNDGDTTLTVESITVSEPWLSVIPMTFSLLAGSSQDVTVTVDAESLSAGTYEGHLHFDWDHDCDGRVDYSYQYSVPLIVSGGGGAQVPTVFIFGGTFMMGADPDSSWYTHGDEDPVHSVTVSSFYMSAYEVTQVQYQAVMGANPSQHPGSDLPVEYVTWYDAAKFCNWLSWWGGLTKFYNDDDLTNAATTVGMNWAANGYRLPTEAEWEYACRAGSITDYYSGDLTHGTCSEIDESLDRIAWYCGNSENESTDWCETHPVGGKQPNRFGLYDMSGNVWEWCNDWYSSNYYESSPSDNPTGPSSGSASGRVHRGGSSWATPDWCQSAARGYDDPSLRNGAIGFRVVKRPQ